MFLELVESLRPRQWTKNLVVFAAIIFSRNLDQPVLLGRTILAFFLFCLLSGAIYLLNDWADRERDRQHPVKCQRPVASGRLEPKVALGTGFGLMVFALLAAFMLSPAFGVAALAYCLLQVAYSFYLKHIVILDVMLIALGFVLRVVSGALVIEVEISSWLLICTILLALFLALGKRRGELTLLDEQAVKHRLSLKEYSPYFLDQMIGVVTASALMAYALYTMAPETIAKFGTTHLNLTIPFVLYGIFRYLYLIYQKKIASSDPVGIILSDPPLLVDILLWLVAVELIFHWSK